MKGDLRCIEGRQLRHDPQHDDPDLETDVGECPDCGGKGCEFAQALEDSPYLAAVLASKDKEIEQLKAALATCQQSLKEQAAARHDPNMPVLKPEVLADIRSDAEAQWAFASGSKGRIRAHGLMLLCDWQDRARAARSEAPTVSTERAPKQLELLKQAETEIHFPGTAKEQGIDIAALIRDAIEEAEMQTNV